MLLSQLFICLSGYGRIILWCDIDCSLICLVLCEQKEGNCVGFSVVGINQACTNILLVDIVT